MALSGAILIQAVVFIHGRYWRICRGVLVDKSFGLMYNEYEPVKH